MYQAMTPEIRQLLGRDAEQYEKALQTDDPDKQRKLLDHLRIHQPALELDPNPDQEPADVPEGLFDTTAQDLTGDWTPEGNQVTKIRRPKKEVPVWARSRVHLLKRIMGDKMMRHYQIAYLFWFLGLSAPEVAAEVHMDVRQIEGILYELKHRRPTK